MEKTLKFMGLGLNSCKVLTYLSPHFGSHQEYENYKFHATSWSSMYHFMAQVFSPKISSLIPKSLLLIHFGKRVLHNVQDVFHVSNLKKCLSDNTVSVPLDEIQVNTKLQFVEEHSRSWVERSITVNKAAFPQ